MTLTPAPFCYYCRRFISFETAMKNWRHIQAPGVADPEPYEIMWCDGCSENGSQRSPASNSEPKRRESTVDTADTKRGPE